MHNQVPNILTGQKPIDMIRGTVTRGLLPATRNELTSYYATEELQELDAEMKQQQKNYADARRRAKPSAVGVGSKVLAQKGQPNKLTPTFEVRMSIK
jgi:hypothetical protein